MGQWFGKRCQQLFRAAVEVMIVDMIANVSQRSVAVTADQKEHRLYTLNFVEDRPKLLCEDSFNLELMVRFLHDEYQKWSLHINLKKTE